MEIIFIEDDYLNEIWLFPMTGGRVIIDCGMIINGFFIVLVNGFIYSKAPSLATNNASINQ